MVVSFFFFNDTATTEIYTLSLHDALPISGCLRGDERGYAPSGRCGRAWRSGGLALARGLSIPDGGFAPARRLDGERRSEEHTSELQSRQYLVCRLLLEKKKKTSIYLLSYH